MKTTAFVLPLLFCLAGQELLSGAAQPVYRQVAAPLEKRVDDLFNQLTPDEKLSLLGGTGFTTQPIPRLAVPPMMMVDAGQGVRGGAQSTLGPATAFPSGILMGSTWDTNLLHRIGAAIGVEARNKGSGAQILLGPAVNIHRSPLGGRNGEYFSEDPHLSAQLGVAYIRGMQSAGVAACLKHFACNNQETDRNDVNAVVGERALREIYLPAFQAGVQAAGVWTVMSSYNKVNGHYASANHRLLTDVLKKEWGFDGMVMSDWGGVHETAVVQAGNDLEMPTGEHMSIPKLKAALADGSVTQAAVDDSVRRILRTIIRVGLLDGPMNRDQNQVNSPAHRQLALEVAEQGIVLLKNERSLLPLDDKKVRSIAVIGQAATQLQCGALGSPEVKPLRVVEFLDGIKARARGIAVAYVPTQLAKEPLQVSLVTPPGNPNTNGFQAEYFKNRDLQGEPALRRVETAIEIENPSLPVADFPNSNFSIRWTARLTAPEDGDYVFTFTGDDGFRVFLDGARLIDHWVEGPETPVSGEVKLQAGRTYDLRVEYFQGGGHYVGRLHWRRLQQSPFAEAVAAAKKADVAIVTVSTWREEIEGRDRPSLDLPYQQADLIRAVATANPRTIVVLNNGAPVAMNDWIQLVPAVVETWFPGQEGGAALAAILFGDVNPSGKLTDTLAAQRADYSDAANFPGQNHQVQYAEGIYVGYRHFDKAGAEPLFPFGHGLSYTTFGYKQLSLSKSEIPPDGSVTASVDVTNTGKRAGAEVVQLYIHDPHPKIDKAVRELKGFAKVALAPAETKTVRFQISPRDLAYFDVAGNQWKAEAGDYDVQIGASSRDLRQRAVLRLNEAYTKPVGNPKLSATASHNTTLRNSN
jgi:beta-glucosidase